MNMQRAQAFANPKVAYLFPGQGSQHVGMGKQLNEHSSAARRVFQEVDDALGMPLTRTMFEGPAEELTRTVNAQPAIMAVSVACLSAMVELLGPERMPKVDFVAGHSLGEYTALVAARVLSLSDAVRLVRERGRLMQVASQERPGGMTAVLGLDEMAVEEICLETGASISNVNADEQVVIAGDRVALARAMDLASVRGAKRLIRLQVSGAFHSPLMQSAVAGMADALSQVEFQDPEVPVVANCTGTPLQTGRSIKEELTRQLCNCVQWHRSMRYMTGAGVRAFYEIGPGRVLSALAMRMERGARVMSVDNWSTLQTLAGAGA